jgi:hypothetical protein
VNFLLLFIPPLLLGTFFLWLGLRGRRVDDHPICRKCGFDLFGRPEGSDLCAECGADLTRPRAIRDGRRARRRGLVAMGVLLLAVALTVGGGVGYATLAAADAQKLKPTWWLVREIDSGDPAVAIAAAKQLSARVTGGKLAQRYIDDAADRLLDIQGNPQAKWDAAFGDFLEDARLAGKLGDQRFHLYAQQAPAFQLVVRPRINRGDPLPFAIREDKARVGSRPTLRVKYSTIYFIDSVVVDKRGMSSQDTLSQHGGGWTGSAMELKKFLDKLPDGPHTTHVEMTQAFFLAQTPAGSQPMFWTKQKISAPFEILPSEPSTVEVVRDESLRPAIENAISIEGAQYQRWNKGAIGFSVDATNLPVDVAFDVYVRFGGAEHRVTHFARQAQPANSTSSHHMSVVVPKFTGGTVDILFKPSVAAAKRTIDVFGVWDGVIVKRDVPVKGRTAATATTTATTRPPS